MEEDNYSEIDLIKKHGKESFFALIVFMIYFIIPLLIFMSIWVAWRYATGYTGLSWFFCALFIMIYYAVAMFTATVLGKRFIIDNKVERTESKWVIMHQLISFPKLLLLGGFITMGTFFWTIFTWLSDNRGLGAGELFSFNYIFIFAMLVIFPTMLAMPIFVVPIAIGGRRELSEVGMDLIDLIKNNKEEFKQVFKRILMYAIIAEIVSFTIIIPIFLMILSVLAFSKFYIEHRDVIIPVLDVREA